MACTYIWLLLIAFVVICSGDCTDLKECVACTETLSWSGDPCRWCPKSNTCHAKGSLFNPCTAQQNKVDPSQCGLNFTYNSVEANRMYLHAAALAYSNTPLMCLNTTIKVNGRYTNIRNYSVPAPNGAIFAVIAMTVADSKEVVIAFRGSENGAQVFWQAYYSLLLPKAPLQLSEVTTPVYIQQYFLLGFTSLQPYVDAYLKEFYVPGYTLTFVGHSLGGAIASIAALWYSPGNIQNFNNDWISIAPPKLYTYGQPRVGDYGYAKIHDQFIRDSWRITHKADIVPHVPWCYGTEVGGVRFCTAVATYPYHNGVEVWYNDDMSNPTTGKQCSGIPINEDKLCSNIYPWPFYLANGVSQHVCYFGRLIGTWCRDGYPASMCSG